MTSIAAKREQFRRLHAAGCFVLPNPWDIGSALYLQHLGAKALATTSAGFAFSRGLADGAVPLNLMLEHLREISAAVDMPVNADFEHGYADDLAGLAENVRRAIDTGVAGLSIEDSTGRSEKPLFEIKKATERIAAAREAIGESGALLVGRAECYLVGNESIEETIARLQAYAAAGADCLYAPGVTDPREIKLIVEAVAPKPVNVLISAPGILTVADAADLGVRRVSVGGALARAAWGGLAAAAKNLLAEGNFDGFANAMPHSELQKLFRKNS